MDTELNDQIEGLGAAVAAFKAEHPEEFAALEAELQGHLDAINSIVNK